MIGYFDLQVNGAFGVDFNGDTLSTEDLEKACMALRNLGVAQFLPTVITDSVDRINQRLERLVKGRNESKIAESMIPGFHVEGPFLSNGRGYVGAHPVEETRDATVELAKSIVDAGQGLVKLMTLAPERDSGGKTTQWLASQNIRVAAGHTDASLIQLQQAIDHGLTSFTHLGNATPPLMARHDNIIQRALSLREQLTIMLIADGHHLPIFVLGNILELIGVEKTIIVTDCISAAGLGPGRFQLGNQSVLVTDDLACRSADGTHFVGSAATMPLMDELLATQLGRSETDRRKLLVENPARYLL